MKSRWLWRKKSNKNYLDVKPTNAWSFQEIRHLLWSRSSASITWSTESYQNAKCWRNCWSRSESTVNIGQARVSVTTPTSTTRTSLTMTRMSFTLFSLRYWRAITSNSKNQSSPMASKANKEALAARCTWPNSCHWPWSFTRTMSIRVIWSWSIR